MSRKYSNTNPPYLEEAAAHFIQKWNPTFFYLLSPRCGQRKGCEGKLWLTKLLNVTDVKDLNADARINATITLS
jgi:hypothetical protein